MINAFYGPLQPESGADAGTQVFCVSNETG